jgi:2-polyprenyl-6-methoxyphenol hydroxylase-like FAD-dependent oxidoreductase
VRTREVFRQWGIEPRLVDAGVLLESVTVHSAAPGGAPLASIDFSPLADEADRPGLLVLEQGETERLLLEAVGESGMCDVRFGAEAVALAPGPEGVRLTIREGEAERSLEGAFVVGCDGAGSFVRGALGLPFEGHTYALRPMLADVRLADARDALPWPRLRGIRGGVTAALRLRKGLWRIISLQGADAPGDEQVAASEVEQRVREALGEGAVEIVWASRFRIHLRSSPRFRVGRVLLAGDAAHIHSPVGGLGMNAGIQDAHNLAWKLAFALRGGDPERLLASYEVERRAVTVEGVSRYADFLTRTFLQTPPPLRAAAFLLLRLGLALPPLRRRMLRRTTMIDLDCPASPLLDARERAAGVRLPNLELRSPEGAVSRLHDLLPAAPVILDIAEERPFAARLPLPTVICIGPGGHRDRSGRLRGLLGHRDGWILVRPDGHIAWARDRLEGMAEAARRALGT